MVEAWIGSLEAGDRAAAWDQFVQRYRRLIFAAIRHYARDYDDVMDVFAHVCEALRDDDLRRLRSYAEQATHRARFSTWLVTVVRNLTIDWFRRRDGRHRLSTIADGLTPLRRRIFEHVFVEHRSHIETFELLRGRDAPALTFHEYLAELRATYRAAADGRRGRVMHELAGALPAEPTVAPADPAVVHDRNARMEAVLQSLSAEDRVAVELYVIEELPAAAIAKTLGLPYAKAVYNRVYRALATVRESLERAGLGREDL